MNASALVALLAEKHKNDVFVVECKTGNFSTSRFDAWAMERSWEKPKIIGYEVKVTRADFLQDDKWHNYLPFCNQFYFVTPYKMVQPVEVPDKCGLLWASMQASRVYTKKKSDYWPAQPDKLANLFKYLILSRMSMNQHIIRSKEEFWKDWIERKKSLLALGHLISKKLYERFEEELNQHKTNADSLRTQLFALETTRKMLESHGIDVTTGFSYHQKDVWDLINADPSNVQDKISACVAGLKILSDHLRKIKEDSAR